jgi:hypothetical protein
MQAPARSVGQPPVEASETRPTSDVATLVWSALSPRPGASAQFEEQAVQRIVALGAPAARVVLEIHLGLLPEPETEDPVDPRAVEARPRIQLAALARLPRTAVQAELDRILGDTSNVDTGLELCRVLAHVGGSDALERILRIAGGLEPIQWERTFVQAQLQDAIARTVGARPVLARTLAARVRTEPAGLAAILARSLAEAAVDDSAEALARALGRDPRLDVVVAESLAHLGDRAGGGLSEAALFSLRGMLESADDRVVRAGASALSVLGDSGSATRLVELLESDSPLVRESAHAALTKLAGARLPREHAAWRSWLETELEWHQTTFEAIRVAIVEDGAEVLAHAALELRKHPLYRHESALALAAALSSESRAAVTFVCATIPAFRSVSVVPALQALIQETQDAEIRVAAERALGLIRPTPTPARSGSSSS